MSEFTELPAAPSYLCNYCALSIKGCLISPHHLWFEVHIFMFDLKQQQFAFLQTPKDVTLFFSWDLPNINLKLSFLHTRWYMNFIHHENVLKCMKADKCYFWQQIEPHGKLFIQLKIEMHYVEKILKESIYLKCLIEMSLFFIVCSAQDRHLCSPFHYALTMNWME